MNRLDHFLAGAALLHLVLAIACGLGLLRDAPAIVGVHPMIKPLKFALSIAIFLGTLSILVPLLSISLTARRAFEVVLVGTMVIEMAIIMTQALRGTTSHYNMASTFDRLGWRAMLVAIIVSTIAMAVLAIVASTRPLATDALSAFAWRAGLWLFQLAIISGFAMGGRGQHTVGATDGGPGLPGVNWSLAHGDLRISHFFALHAIQIVPLVALATSPLGDRNRWVALLAAIAVQASVIVWTLVRAFAGATPW